MSGMQHLVSAQLQAEGKPTWEHATRHPMVLEIGDGSLPREKFRFYFSQNILYLEDYARALGLIAGKAPDTEVLEILARFLGRIVEDELPANRRFFERLGGTPSEIGPRDMSMTTYGYTRHLLYVSAQGDCAAGLAAVLPCQWSYGELAKPLSEHLPDDPVYADWIRMFGNDEYGELVEQTTGLLDRLVDPRDERRMEELSRIFQMSTQFEVMFWDMAYEGP